jgi:succinate dehydrogenase cytochrome b subunit
MAQAGSSVRNRPLSPHLQIWRWGPAMLASILHRVSGVGATVGLGLMVWWLGALVAGPDTYARFSGLVWGPFGDWSTGSAIFWSLTHLFFRIVVIGCTWALFMHALTGIRHFLLDTGAGYELDTNNFWAAATVIGGLILTAAFWAAVLLR